MWIQCQVNFNSLKTNYQNIFTKKKLNKIDPTNRKKARENHQKNSHKNRSIWANKKHSKTFHQKKYLNCRIIFSNKSFFLNMIKLSVWFIEEFILFYFVGKCRFKNTWKRIIGFFQFPVFNSLKFFLSRWTIQEKKWPNLFLKNIK